MSYWGGSAPAADPKNSWISFLPFFASHLYSSKVLLRIFSLSLCRSCSSFLCYVIISLLLFVEFLTLSPLYVLLVQFQFSSGFSFHTATAEIFSFWSLSFVRCCISAFVFSSPEPETAKSRSINERARANTLNTHASSPHLLIHSRSSSQQAEKRRMRRHKNIKFILFTLAGASRESSKAHANFSNGIERDDVGDLNNNSEEIFTWTCGGKHLQLWCDISRWRRRNVIVKLVEFSRVCDENIKTLGKKLHKFSSLGRRLSLI